MTMKLYAVRDLKADAFGAPMSSATDGLARRAFIEACLDPRSDLAKYPEDYQMYQVGEYEPNSGLVTPVLPTPRLIMSAIEAKASSVKIETPQEIARRENVAYTEDK